MELHILDLTRPLVFPPVLEQKTDKLVNREPPAGALNDPWQQYAVRVQAAYYEDGVTENFTSFLARALKEAHDMGAASIKPLPPGQPRPPYKTKADPQPSVQRVMRRAAPAPAPASEPTPPPSAPKRIVRARQ